MAKQESVSVETLSAILDEFNEHDLDAIMEFFADDCVFDMPRGPDPWGKRYRGKAAVREGLATRFKGLPNVHYGNDRHWVSGDMGVSEWPPARQQTECEFEYKGAISGSFGAKR
jgi:ketosteroid isomerase-like protein